MSIKGSTILITGAGGGIGSALAKQLAARGAELVLAARDLTSLRPLSAELMAMGKVPLLIPADLSQPGVPARLVRDSLDFVDRIDMLINCAGVQNFGFFADESADQMATLLNVNVAAPMALVGAVLPQMLKAGKGHIVNVGSIFGSIGFPCFTSYSASKFALRGFSEALRRELTGTGVQVTYVAPRFTKTPFNRGPVARMAKALKMNQDDPDSVAAEIVAAIERKEHNRYLGWPEKLFVRINSLLPRLVDGPLMKQVDQMRPYATERN
jgi:short-subunit dehydrogenase